MGARARVETPEARARREEARAAKAAVLAAAKAERKRAADAAKARKAADRAQLRAAAVAAKKAVADARKREIEAAKAISNALAGAVKTARSAAGARLGHEARAQILSRVLDAVRAVEAEIRAFNSSDPLTEAPAHDSRAKLLAALESLRRRGHRGAVELPAARREVGMTVTDFHALLRAMWREPRPQIDLQIAANPGAVAAREEGIQTNDGLIYYVSLRSREG